MLGDKNKQLDSCEISGLWESYMVESLIICVLKHMLNNVVDEETRSILKLTFDLSNQHKQAITNIFNQAELPVPEAFNDNDVNLNAPRLFTDEFYLFYLSDIARSGIYKYGQTLSYSAHPDIRGHYTKCVKESSDLYNKVAELRLSKGNFIRTPIIETTKKVQYIEGNDFFMDWFGEKRSMTLSEINQIAIVLLSDTMGMAITTGFGQVSNDKKIKDFMFKVRDLSSKKIEIFSSVLAKENIPIPSISISFVNDSTIAPFSEKLMMFHIVALGSVSVINKGIALGNTLRSDLEVSYFRLMLENMKYIKSGADIMVEKRWLEQPPQMIKHEELEGISH